jgi:uncharacterized OB-fold protein
MTLSPSGASGTAVSIPVPDEDSAAYWAALREHRILLQRCTSCGETRAPRMPGCPQCGSAGYRDIEVRGTGTIYSWVVIHRPLGGIPAQQLPRTIVTVELDEGCRVLGRLVRNAGEAARVGMDLPVEAVFVDHEGWTELAFDLVGRR